ncbi:MAG: D-tyrosyl-tRNA(Tyr) deacylase [Bacteroidetes bacterium]|nr:MAG: D-tyrosyl-tRNA(Tyr) deacylase [Bacteroidota bacterium]
MRALIQRSKHASVTVQQQIVGSITHGLIVLLGIEEADTEADLQWLCHKIVALRIFADDAGAMNKNVLEVGGNILLISQFTLHASTAKGNRPSFLKAAKPVVAQPLYQQAISYLNTLLPQPIATGIFGADMQVALVNDGPVTIWIDTKNKE